MRRGDIIVVAFCVGMETEAGGETKGGTVVSLLWVLGCEQLEADESLLRRVG